MISWPTRNLEKKAELLFEVVHYAVSLIAYLTCVIFTAGQIINRYELPAAIASCSSISDISVYRSELYFATSQGLKITSTSSVACCKLLTRCSIYFFLF